MKWAGHQFQLKWNELVASSSSNEMSWSPVPAQGDRELFQQFQLSELIWNCHIPRLKAKRKLKLWRLYVSQHRFIKSSSFINLFLFNVSLLKYVRKSVSCCLHHWKSEFYQWRLFFVAKVRTKENEEIHSMHIYKCCNHFEILLLNSVKQSSLTGRSVIFLSNLKQTKLPISWICIVSSPRKSNFSKSMAKS
jgi:hypothetical protein